MTTPIDDIRKEIDTVDKQLHELLMKRADLAVRIGQEKKKSGLPMIQPEREAVVVRRLVDRHSGPLQKSAVVRIWRELVSAVSILQQPDMKIAIYAPGEQSQDYTDMARGYFGGVMPMHYVANPLVAVSMVRDGDASFAVLPWPEDDAENPWWTYLKSDDKPKAMNVVVRLPYANRTNSGTLPQYRALVIGCLNFASSGTDHSFLILDLDHDVSRARIVDKLKSVGLKALSLYSCRAQKNLGRSTHLAEVESFVGADDPKLADLLAKFEDDAARCIPIGGYPLLPFLKDEAGGKKKKTA